MQNLVDTQQCEDPSQTWGWKQDITNNVEEVHIEEVDQKIFPELSANNSRSLIIIASNSRGCHTSYFSPVFPVFQVEISPSQSVSPSLAYTSYTSPSWRHHHLKQSAVGYPGFGMRLADEFGILFGPLQVPTSYGDLVAERPQRAMERITHKWTHVFMYTDTHTHIYI